MKLYKLTDAKSQTRGLTQWGENVTHKALGPGGEALCSESYIHTYTHPLLAVLFNPIHADFHKPLLWEAEGEVAKTDGLKVGCRTLTTIRQIPLPKIAPVDRVHFAVLAAKSVYLVYAKNSAWLFWADGWLSGQDRSAKSAQAVALAAWDDAALVLPLEELWAMEAAIRAAQAASAERIALADEVAEATASAAIFAVRAATPKKPDFLSMIQAAMREEAKVGG